VLGSFLALALATALSVTESGAAVGTPAQAEVDAAQTATDVHATVEVRFEGVDAKGYELVNAQFELDGQPLFLPGSKSGRWNLFFGMVPPGPHTLNARASFKQPSGNTLLSQMEPYRFEVPDKAPAQARQTRVIQIYAWIRAHEQLELAKRLEFVAQTEARPEKPAAEKAPPAALVQNQRPPPSELPPQPPPPIPAAPKAETLSKQAQVTPARALVAKGPSKKSASRAPARIPLSLRRALASPTAQSSGHPPPKLLDSIRERLRHADSD
jgi:hypothetical protein